MKCLTPNTCESYGCTGECCPGFAQTADLFDFDQRPKIKQSATPRTTARGVFFEGENPDAIIGELL